MQPKITLFHILLLMPLALAIPNPAKTESKTESKASKSESSSGSSEAGSSIDFSKFALQLPIGQPGKPETIAGSKLSSYTDPKHEYYYKDPSTGAIVMKVPGSPASTGCVHTANSKHCRTELQEVSPASWDPKAATTRLTSTLMVVKADDSATGTCIGQIHIEESVSVRPVAELYYNSRGDITFGVEQTRKGGNEKNSPVGNVPVGTKFTYTIAYEGNVLSVSLNGGAKKTFSTASLDAPPSYFKAGNYNQGNSASEIHFFDVKVEH
jgi:hypothetical protein